MGSPRSQFDNSQFENLKVVVVETYCQNRKPFQTPQLFILKDKHLYLRTPRQSEKARRILNNPNIRIAPSDYSGKPKGEWQVATAKVHDDASMRWVNKAMNQAFGWSRIMALFREWIRRGCKGIDYVVIEVDFMAST